MSDDRRREERLAAIRSRRGSEERLAVIARLQEETARRAVRRPSSSADRKSPANSDSYFGHSWDEWFRMRDIGYQFIADRARVRGRVTYGEVWDAVQKEIGSDIGPPWRQLPHLLGYIAEKGLKEIGLVPTALVTYDVPDAGPGAGFFRLCVRDGLLPADDAPPDGDGAFTMTPAQRTFWSTHCEALYERFAEP